jgi:hypothetical protein
VSSQPEAHRGISYPLGNGHLSGWAGEGILGLGDEGPARVGHPITWTARPREVYLLPSRGRRPHRRPCLGPLLVQRHGRQHPEAASPGCLDCNNRYSAIEDRLRERLVLAFARDDARVAGIQQDALRGIDPSSTIDQREKRVRGGRLARIAREASEIKAPSRGRLRATA